MDGRLLKTLISPQFRQPQMGLFGWVYSPQFQPQMGLLMGCCHQGAQYNFLAGRNAQLFGANDDSVCPCVRCRLVSRYAEGA
jgi:hypothetical protein